jgi:UDP-3-O-[3-hydroxymyristoyl] glucosamine N-acyltransferase
LNLERRRRFEHCEVPAKPNDLNELQKLLFYLASSRFPPGSHSNPRAEIRKMDQVRPTLVKHGATLGANCTIVCGVTIGRYAFIGAGAVVNRNIADHALVVGNPARQIGWACRCGERLPVDLKCSICQRQFVETPDGLSFKKGGPTDAA